MTAEYTAVILSAPPRYSTHRSTRVRLCTNVFHHKNIIRTFLLSETGSDFCFGSIISDSKNRRCRSLIPPVYCIYHHFIFCFSFHSSNSFLPPAAGTGRAYLYRFGRPLDYVLSQSLSYQYKNLPFILDFVVI